MSLNMAWFVLLEGMAGLSENSHPQTLKDSR